MAYWLAANLLVVFHLGFVCFVLCGGLLVFRWRRLALLHLPAAAWGAWIEFRGWVCPLTPLEQQLRQAAGGAGYSGGFIERYLLPVLYPERLDHDVQFVLGAVVVVVNLAVYGWLLASANRGGRTG